MGLFGKRDKATRTTPLYEGYASYRGGMPGEIEPDSMWGWTKKRLRVFPDEVVYTANEGSKQERRIAIPIATVRKAYQSQERHDITVAGVDNVLVIECEFIEGHTSSVLFKSEGMQTRKNSLKLLTAIETALIAHKQDRSKDADTA